MHPHFIYACLVVIGQCEPSFIYVSFLVLCNPTIISVMHHWVFVPPLPHSDYVIDVSVKLVTLGLCGLARWPVMTLVGLGRDSGGIRA